MFYQAFIGNWIITRFLNISFRTSIYWKQPHDNDDSCPEQLILVSEAGKDFISRYMKREIPYYI